MHPEPSASQAAEDLRVRRIWWRLFTAFLSLLILLGTYYHIAFAQTPLRFRSPWTAERPVERTVTVPYDVPALVVETSLPVFAPVTPAP